MLSRVEIGVQFLAQLVSRKAYRVGVLHWNQCPSSVAVIPGAPVCAANRQYVEDQLTVRTAEVHE